MQSCISLDEEYPSGLRDCDIKFLFAILERAYQDCFLTSKKVKREAVSYIFSDIVTEFSFNWVINELNMPILRDIIRNKVKHLR